MDRTLALLNESGISLQRSPIDDQLSNRESTGTRPVVLTASAYRAEKLRQLRAVELDGGSSLQVLNLCIFPELDFALPTFAADLVTLPGGHLIAIDCAPNGVNLASCVPASEGYSELEAAYKRHRPRLPDGGPLPEAAKPFFSPLFLWSRLPISTGAEELNSLLLPAFEDYLRAYLRMVGDAAAIGDGEGATRRAVREAQLGYADYRAEKDPARGMLGRLFGDDFTERLIFEVLFDLRRHLDAHPAEGLHAEGGEGSEGGEGGEGGVVSAS